LTISSEVIVRNALGKEFQTVGAATLNARSPVFVLVPGTLSRHLLDELTLVGIFMLLKLTVISFNYAYYLLCCDKYCVVYIESCFMKAKFNVKKQSDN